MYSLLAISINFVFIAAIISQAGAAYGSTLENVVERDELICGIRGGTAGFGQVSGDGVWSGFDVDFCRAIAVAVLKDSKKVEFIPLSTSARFKALQDYEIDVLIRNTTWTYTNDTNLDLEFTGINFYDGQGFIAWQQPGKSKLRDYPPETKICMIKKSTSLTNLYDHLQKKNLTFNIVEFTSTTAAENHFLSNKCELFSSDRSILASLKAVNTQISRKLIILDDIISKEPLGPVVRNNDTLWKEIVQWTLFATIQAEEMNISQANVDDVLKKTNNPAILFFLGDEPGIGKGVNLDDKWVYRIIKQIGNYGEIFERNLNPSVQQGWERGINNIWTKGGLHYSPPFR